MKAVVFTLGCKVNECESDSLITGLKNLGYEVSDKLEKADIYIVNTCAVTAEAEKKSRQTASRIYKLNPKAKIIFTGCASQKNPSQFSGKGDNMLVTGVYEKQKILDMLTCSGENLSCERADFEELLPVSSLRTRTYIKVQDGCNNFCSYCIIPYLRGRTRSRNPQSVIEEINITKPTEAIINGIDLSSYNHNGVDLAGLLENLQGVDTRIRLGSLEANVITDSLLSASKKLKNFAPHFHLSLQAGSDAVLKKMNRKYTAEEFLSKVELIRKYYDNAGITTDVIAGFPTETEEDFEKTLEVIKKAEFSDIHPFIFSPREGTVAYKMPDLPHQIKKARLDKLMQLKAELKEKFALSNVGKTLEMLPEKVINGYLEGYSENYLRLYLPVDKAKQQNEKIIKVQVVSPYLDGALVKLI